MTGKNILIAELGAEIVRLKLELKRERKRYIEIKDRRDNLLTQNAELEAHVQVLEKQKSEFEGLLNSGVEVLEVLDMQRAAIRALNDDVDRAREMNRDTYYENRELLARIQELEAASG